jgi:dephospho-CoA kinase
VLKVALTGNFGSGKSFILGVFKGLGAFCVDADEIVAGLLCQPDVLAMIKEAAGEEVFEGGNLVKKRLADRVFSNPELRRKIEGIIHPLVIERIETLLAGSSARVAVVEVPLLFEKGLEGMFDRTITVCAGEELAVKRLGLHGISPEEAKRRIAAQMPVQEKMKRSDYVILNDGTREEAAGQAEKIYRGLLALSGRSTK